jgi:hypothetical protein
LRADRVTTTERGSPRSHQVRAWESASPKNAVGQPRCRQLLSALSEPDRRDHLPDADDWPTRGRRGPRPAHATDFVMESPTSRVVCRCTLVCTCRRPAPRHPQQASDRAMLMPCALGKGPR